MAVQPGEENVATLFGDIHYFYGPPTNNPPHHRFDKGSYVYLFENANERRARVEVANQPGTDDQDAFDGFLDTAHVRYSYKQHCMVSLTVGETTDQNEWHLPTYDPRNEKKYHYKLHSMDIYFWTRQDALQFVNGVRRVLPPSQVEVLDEPAPPAHQAAMSSVVQKLENAAISDPAYSTPKPPPQGVPNFAPPPMSAVSSTDQPGSFAPMPYNPAAPAAPEVIRHREKTPPPDDDPVHPLAAVVAYDSQAPFSPGFVPPPGFQNHGLASPGLPPPPFGHPGLQRSATMPVHGGLASPGLASPGLASPGLASPGLASPYGSAFPGSPGFQPPPPPPQAQQATPTPPVTSPGLTPPGGYSQFQYGAAQATQAGRTGSQDYSIHQQVYRPTELEQNKYKNVGPKPEPKGKLEENAGRLERGVTGMFKKFEKKFG